MFQFLLRIGVKTPVFFDKGGEVHTKIKILTSACEHELVLIFAIFVFAVWICILPESKGIILIQIDDGDFIRPVNPHIIPSVRDL